MSHSHDHADHSHSGHSHDGHDHDGAKRGAHRHAAPKDRHDHRFGTDATAQRSAERRLGIVAGFTLAFTALEIGVGWWTQSMALLADGWHMATDALALAIAALAYWLARRYAADPRFTFGTWKIELLAGFGSALMLMPVALGMAYESIERFVHPREIAYAEALWVAALGLLVNVASAWFLRDSPHDHGHGGHGHDHGHDHAHEAGADHNMRVAYAHLLADALTSLLAILALLAGRFAGLGWLDPLMGLIGAGLIGWWSVRLMRGSGRALLDRAADPALESRVREAIESDRDAEITDFHLWQVGRNSTALILAVVADEPLSPDAYRARLKDIPGLTHISIEVNRCGAPPVSPPQS